MNICKNCFCDEEMQAVVSNESHTEGTCDFCGQQGLLMDIDYFSDFFEEVLSLFAPSESGISIAELIQRDWTLFSSKEIGEKILGYFLDKNTFNYTVKSKVDYAVPILEKMQVWNSVKKQVRESSRFFADTSSFDDMHLIVSNATIPEGSVFFRSRVLPSGVEKLKKKEMGCPPKDKATAGRANPLGIPYLYLCQDEVTTYYEVRALYLDRLGVAKFRATEDLNILDFTSKLSLYIAYANATEPLSDVIVRQKILQAISRDMSKPLRRYDSELEYVPTQLVCEICKLNGMDGILFESSLHKGGINVVLFDASKAKCVSVKSVEIGNVQISS